MFFLINNLARYIEEHISVNNKTPETLKHPDIRIFIEQQRQKIFKVHYIHVCTNFG